MAEDNFSLYGQPGAEELPTADAWLTIELVPVQDGEAVKRVVSPGQPGDEPAGWPARAEGSSSLYGRPGAEELPTADAWLTIKLVAVQAKDGEVVKDAASPGQPGDSRLMA